MPIPNYEHINYLIHECTSPLEEGQTIFIPGHGYGRVAVVGGPEVPHRIIVSIAFPIGNRGTVYQRFWAAINQDISVEEPEEQVSEILGDMPPNYTTTVSYPPPY